MGPAAVWRGCGGGLTPLSPYGRSKTTGAVSPQPTELHWLAGGVGKLACGKSRSVASSIGRRWPVLPAAVCGLRLANSVWQVVARAWSRLSCSTGCGSDRAACSPSPLCGRGGWGVRGAWRKNDRRGVDSMGCERHTYWRGKAADGRDDRSATSAGRNCLAKSGRDVHDDDR